MPYKSDKCIIQGTKYDRRRKLTTAQRDQIAAMVGVSTREIARRFGISRRLVQFIQHPERLKNNLLARQKRGGWRQYYNRADHSNAVKNLRKYKNTLYRLKKISLPAKKYLTP